MRSPLSEPKEKNPELLAQDGVSEGIEALPKRVERYGKARKSALDVAEYMQGLPGQQAKAVSQRVMSCGDYLLFRHFFTVDKVKPTRPSSAKPTCSAPCARFVAAPRLSRPTWSAGKPSGCSGPPCALSWSRSR